MSRFIYLLFFLCSLIALKVPAQNLNEIQFESLDEKDGLSNNWINAMAIDSSGFLWIATEGGLNRYDGHHFKQFRHDKKSTGSLLNNNVQNIAVAENGDVWVSYPGGSFSLYRSECACFTHYNSGIKMKNKSDESFGIRFIDADNNLWYSGNGLGLNKFLVKENKTLHFDLPFSSEPHEPNDAGSNIVNYMYEDEAGLLWLCTDHGLYSFNRKNNTFSYKKYTISSSAGKQKDCFMKLIPDGGKGLWLASFNGGLSYFSLQAESFQNYSVETKDFGFNNLIYDFAQKDATHFWIVSGDKGLGVFDKQNGHFEFRSDMINLDGSRFSFLKQVIITPKHEMIIADETSLLKYIPYNKYFNFKYLSIEKSQHGNLFVIRKIVENPALNEIYFATEFGNGLNVLNTSTNKLLALRVDVNERIDKKMRLKNLITDRDSQMWLLSRDYLYGFDPVQKKLHKISHALSAENEDQSVEFKNFVQDGDQAIFVLTSKGGIHRFDSKAMKLLPKLVIKNNSDEIRKVEFAVFDSNHRLWLIGDGKMACSDQQNFQFDFIHDTLLTKLLTNEIKAVGCDNKSNIWISTAADGLLKIEAANPKNLQIKLYSESDKLPTNQIFNMGIDPQENVWMSTILGIVYFNTAKEEYKIFNQMVGMSKYIHGIRFIKAGGQSFYITAPGNYCKVDFDKINQPKATPVVYIDKINVLKEQIPISAGNDRLKIILKPDQNSFSFDFGCLDFSNQSYHQFAYQLEGWDKEWQMCGGRRFANYTNVVGGDYLFKVKVTNASGQWSEIKSVKLYIQTPFYKTTWFRILFVLLIAVLLAAFYQHRLKQQEQMFYLKSKTQLLEKEKTMVMYESLKQQLNPHFLFNSLTSLSGLIELDQQLAGQFLEQMSGIYRYILKNGDNETVTLRDEIQFVKLYISLQQTRFNKGLVVNIDVPDKYLDNKIAPVTLQNLIENAIKHNIIDAESPLRIDITIEGDYLVIKNNLQKKSMVETSNKKGLIQFMTLYEYISPRPVLVNEEENYFIIKIPLI